MADVLTAGTFIGAVLEQAGYIAQATYLKSFRDFFREAGAFVYLLGAIGGVFSMVMFGSFRAARYLILGPAIYWFLIGPTTKIDGVEWKIGGGQARGVNQMRGDAVSRADVNRAVKDSGLGDGSEGIEVATGFVLFSRLISSLMNGFSDLILSDEDGEYLQHIARGRALETLLSIQPEDPNFVEMMEGDFAQNCSEMFGYGVALASFDLHPSVIGSGGPGAESAKARSGFYTSEYKKYGEGVRLNPNAATRSYLQARIGADAQVPGSITCDQMWKIISQYLYDQAKPAAAKILDLARGDDGDATLACQRLREKVVVDGGEGACNLQEVVALFLLRNSVMERRAMGRFVGRIAHSVGEPKGITDGTGIPISGKLGLDTINDAEKLYGEVTSGQRSLYGLNGRDEQLYIVGMGQRVAASSEYLGDKQAQERIREQFISVARVSSIGGPLDAGFMEYPKYHLRDLRQQLFTGAMNLPYWQGVLLYVIAVSYPFMALIVLLPGRAPGFLNLPLAWLWVKSWDVGMAFVMVFERVLWNVLPSMDISKEVADQPLSGTDMYTALSETQKFDHVWNLHLYYICLALVTFSIPMVTGYATLKMKRAVLSSFTDKWTADAKESGAAAAGAHGMSVMSDRVRMISEVAGMAARVPTNKGNGFESNLRDTSARFFANIAVSTKLAEMAPDLMAKGGLDPKAIATRVAATPGMAATLSAEYTKVYAEMHQAETKAAMEFSMSFHPLLGRYGKLAAMNEGFAAAMDGSGGFEMNQIEKSPIDAYIDLHNRKVDKLYEYHARLIPADMIAHQVLDTPVGELAFMTERNGGLDPAALAERITTSMNYLRSNEIFREVNQVIRAENQGIRDKKEWTPELGNLEEYARAEMESPGVARRVLGLTPTSLENIEKVKADTENTFSKRFEYSLEAEIQKAPLHIQQQLQPDGVQEGLIFSGENNGFEFWPTRQGDHVISPGATRYGEEASDSRPQRLNEDQSSINPTDSAQGLASGIRPHVGQLSPGTSGYDNPQSAFPSIEAETQKPDFHQQAQLRNDSFQDGLTLGGERNSYDIPQSAFVQMKMPTGDQYLEPTPVARPWSADRMFGGEHSHSRSEKERLAHLQMDWFFGDDEELRKEEEHRHRKQLSPRKPGNKLA